MSDGPIFEGMKQYGDGPNPENDPPEPHFDSPLLGLEGMVIALKPEAQRIEQRLTAIAGKILARLIYTANKYCTSSKPELAATAAAIETGAMEHAQPEMDRDALLAEYALKNRPTILAFNDDVRAVRNNEPSTKLNDTLSRIESLREALGHAA
jgi:hypothetical protein